MDNRKRRNPTIQEYAAYGIGGIFINLGIIAEQFGMYYMTNVALLPSAVVGSMLMFTTLFDAVNDPIIGGMADRCNTRMGKYRPFILLGAIFMCITMVLRFTVPPLGTVGKVVYYLIIMMLYSVSFTMCCVPWQAMSSVLTRDYKARNLLLTVRLTAGALTGTVIGAALLRGVERLGGGAAGWQRFILLVWCIGLPAAFICQRGMRFVDYPGSIPTPPRRTVFHHMLQLAKNRPVVCVCAAISLSSLTQTINNVSSMYYYEYVLGDTSVLELTAIYSLPISLACNFAIPFVLERMDKRHLLLAAYCISLVKPVAIWIFGASLSVRAALGLIVFSYIGASLYGASIFSWVPECVDWTSLHHGAGEAGIISAFVTFAQKLGRAFSQWLTGILMGLVGFHAALAIQPEVVGVILNLNGLYQILGYSLTLIPIFLFPISKAGGDRIRKDLSAQEDASVTEPWHPGP